MHYLNFIFEYFVTRFEKEKRQSEYFLHYYYFSFTH